MHSVFLNSSITILFLILISTEALACDLCQMYQPRSEQKEQNQTFLLGLTEQYTYFGSLQVDGRKIQNEFHQHLSSSITQVITGYQLDPQLQLQISLPFISRSFRRVVEEELEKGKVEGIGDMLTMINYQPYSIEKEHTSLLWRISAGLKFPTGDAHELGQQHEHENEMELADHHSDEIPDGIHNHDLALGSGSFDYVLGTNLALKSNEWISNLSIQYSLRNEGSFNYRYGNDLLWKVDLGRSWVVEDMLNLEGKGVLSGEYKEKDVVSGQKENDTAITTLFAGPEVTVILANGVRFLTALELPLSLENTGTQIVPDYRLRLALDYSF